MDSVRKESGCSGYTMPHKPFEGVLNILSSLEAKQQFAKKLTYKIEEVVFVLFITILIPIVLMVISLLASYFYLQHFYIRAMELIEQTEKEQKKKK